MSRFGFRTRPGLVTSTLLGNRGFAPNFLPGLVLWLDADDADTITLNGGNVSGWADKSTSENDAAQANSSRQPLRVTNALNTRTVLRFDSDWMTCPTAVWTGAAARTMFVVYKSTATGTYTNSVAGQATGNTAGTWFMLQARTQAVTGDPYLAGYAADLTGPTPDNAWKIAAVTYNGTAAAMYKNGGSANSGDLTLDTSTNVFRIAHAVTTGAETEFLAGDIAEVICYDTALSTANRDAVEWYLATKWGITLS